MLTSRFGTHFHWLSTQLRGVVILILVVAAQLAGCASRPPAARFIIDNPYQHVDWTKDRQFKANFHTHSNMSDGREAPASVIDLYRDVGYSVLAITDHDILGPDGGERDPKRHQTTWPWQKFGRDPQSLGMVAIEGNEITRNHHIGSYFNDYGDADVNSEHQALTQIGSRGGLAVFFHPGRHEKTVAWYVDFFRRFDHLLGLEVYNQGDRYPKDRETWDKILSVLSPSRKVWGFSNDDMHKPWDDLGRNWNILILPELSLHEVRRAIENGSFLFVYSPMGHAAPPPPVIKAITVYPESASIYIQTSGHEAIDWISRGEIIGRGERLDFAGLITMDGYVRAKIHGSDGIVVGTQPFGIRRVKVE